MDIPSDWPDLGDMNEGWDVITGNFNPEEARDKDGQWTAGGSSQGSSASDLESTAKLFEIPAADRQRMIMERPKVTEKIKGILSNAREIPFTDDVISSGGSSDIGRRDHDEIEAKMTNEERDEMESALDASKEWWIDDEMNNYDADDDIDIEDAERNAGWRNKEIQDNATAAVNEIEIDEEAKTKAKEEIDAWYDSSNASGTDGIDDLAAHLKEKDVDAKAIAAVEDLRSTAESEIEDAKQEMRDQLKESRRNDLAYDYDSSYDRAEYLSNFFDNNEDRFTDSGNTVQKQWGFNKENNRIYTFPTSFGENYEVWANKLEQFELKFDHVAFNDSRGSFSITGKAGAAGAAEVFRNVATAVSAYVIHEDPKFMTFSAAEKSRSKLYDHLTRTMAAAFPQYRAVVFRSGKHSQYGLIRRDGIDEFEKAVDQKGGGKKGTVLVNAKNYTYLNPDVDLRWFSHHGWHPDSTNTSNNWNPITGNTWSPQAREAAILAIRAKASGENARLLGRRAGKTGLNEHIDAAMAAHKETADLHRQAASKFGDDNQLRQKFHRDSAMLHDSTAAGFQLHKARLTREKVKSIVGEHSPTKAQGDIQSDILGQLNHPEHKAFTHETNPGPSIAPVHEVQGDRVSKVKAALGAGIKGALGHVDHKLISSGGKKNLRRTSADNDWERLLGTAKPYTGHGAMHVTNHDIAEFVFNSLDLPLDSTNEVMVWHPVIGAMFDNSHGDLVINKWSDQARMAAQLSRQAHEASTNTPASAYQRAALGHSALAVGHATADRHIDAAKAHDAAASNHIEAMRGSTGPALQAHSNAAEWHAKASKAHYQLARANNALITNLDPQWDALTGIDHWNPIKGQTR